MQSQLVRRKHVRLHTSRHFHYVTCKDIFKAQKINYSKEAQKIICSLKENNLDEALNRFNEAITKASSDKQTAKAYLGLAKVYALKQRYGSAFSNAQKAHNLYPTYESHLLIAKLNFKTGQAAKAEQSIKRVLEKDFSSDFR